MAKSFNKDNSGEFVLPSLHSVPSMVIFNFLSLTYHHLAITLDFTSSFTLAYFGGAHPFSQLMPWLYWYRYHFFLYLYTPKPATGQFWRFFYLSFSLLQKKSRAECCGYFHFFLIMMHLNKKINTVFKLSRELSPTGWLACSRNLYWVT